MSMNKEGAPPPLPLVVPYTPFYCEETVYYLAQTYYRYSKEIRDNWNLTVVFVSNADEKVALWNQNVGDPDEPMNPTIWDYHCFLAMHGHGRSWVIDYSSRLEMPCRLSEYVQQTFRCSLVDVIPQEYRAVFRVIPALDFIQWFASDRSHMIKSQKQNGEIEYIHTPPEHELISGDSARKYGIANNLKLYVNMQKRPPPERERTGHIYMDVEFFKWADAL